MERQSGGHDDEPERRRGRDHAEGGIEPERVYRAAQMSLTPAGLLSHRFAHSGLMLFLLLALMLLLNLFGGLPEEQIGADGGSQHGDGQRQEVWCELNRGDHGGAQQRQPVWVNQNAGQQIGQQREGQQLEHARIVAIGDEDFEQQDAHREDDEYHAVGQRGRQQPHRGGHRAQVSADVDGIGDEEQQHRAIENGATIVAAHTPGDTARPSPGQCGRTSPGRRSPAAKYRAPSRADRHQRRRRPANRCRYQRDRRRTRQ